MTFGNKILKLRKEKGLSQDALAELLGVSRQAISKWELGEAMPDISNVIHLSQFFHVSLDFLLNDEYRGDANIPTVNETEQNEKNRLNKRAHILTYVLLITGVVGLLSLFIFSSIVPVTVMQPLLETQSDVNIAERNEELSETTEEVYYVQKEVIGFGPFLTYFLLEVVFVSLGIMTISGAAMWLNNRRKFQAKEQDERSNT
ncbi:MAG: helix-turn-helix domain-containing protein [Oscillospiraceae bacterium]|nr:helix-turn-helix domain-containing protein [Oscillospiraceae bacterium]